MVVQIRGPTPPSTPPGAAGPRQNCASGTRHGPSAHSGHGGPVPTAMVGAAQALGQSCEKEVE